MLKRLTEARERLAELEKIENPTDEQAGSIEYLRAKVLHLEVMTTPDK